MRCLLSDPDSDTATPSTYESLPRVTVGGMTTARNTFALPASLLARFVELADRAHWVSLIASGWTPAEIVALVLARVEPPVTIDGAQRFVGAVRTMPGPVWRGQWSAGVGDESA